MPLQLYKDRDKKSYNIIALGIRMICRSGATCLPADCFASAG